MSSIDLPTISVPLTVVEKVKEYGNLAGKSTDVKKVLDALMNWILSEVAAGRPVSIPKMIKISRALRGARTFRNPNPDAVEKTTSKEARYAMVVTVMAGVKTAMEDIPVNEDAGASEEEPNEDEDASEDKPAKAAKGKKSKKPVKTKKVAKSDEDEEMSLPHDEEDIVPEAPVKADKKPKPAKEGKKVKPVPVPVSDEEAAPSAPAPKKGKGKKGGKEFEMKTEAYDAIGDLSDE